MPENAAPSPAIAPDALQPALDLQRTLLRRGALLVALLLLGLGLWSGQALGRAERAALPATARLVAQLLHQDLARQLSAFERDLEQVPVRLEVLADLERRLPLCVRLRALDEREIGAHCGPDAPVAAPARWLGRQLAALASADRPDRVRLPLLLPAGIKAGTIEVGVHWDQVGLAWAERLLLLLGLGLLLGAAGLASLIAAHLQLSGLQVEAMSAEPVAAGQVLVLRVALAARAGRRRRGLRGELDPASAWTSLGDDGHAELALPLPTRQRGWLEPGRLRLSTTQPLGLARAWSRVWPQQPLLVYPRAESDPPPLPDGGGDARLTRLHPLGEDPHQLRPYRTGDAPRTIAWKHSARRDSLVVREYERAQQQDVVLDWRALHGLAHEARISRLAGWIDLAEREGRRYRLRLPAQPDLGPGQGSEHRHACLRALALLPGA